MLSSDDLFLESNKEIQTTIHKHKKGRLTGLARSNTEKFGTLLNT
jgi:hypothetical protein